MPIIPGQTYRSVAPRDQPPIRIRVRSHGPGFPAWGWSKVKVVTVLPDGTEVRERAIEAIQLHDSPTTKTGQPRRTGYVLDTPNPTTSQEG